MKVPALVLGSYVNSLSVVRGLAVSDGVGEIWLLSERQSVANFSRFVSESRLGAWGADSSLLVNAMITVAKEIGKKMTLFPTHDFHVKVIGSHIDELNEYFYVTVNPDVTEDVISKKWQYELCERIGVPYPQTKFCESREDANHFFANKDKIDFPVLLKPFSRASDSQLGHSFRALTVNGVDELEALKLTYPDLLTGGFLSSEIIIGGDDQIWAYTAFLPRKGRVHAGWTGRKLSQSPPRFGVFASAEAVCNPEVEMLGKKLLEATGHIGIGEPEFKFDERDGKYKLMEINPRVMMWHGCGLLAGVNLVLMQHYYSTGEFEQLDILPVRQCEIKKRLVYLSHELMNLIRNPLEIRFYFQLITALCYRHKSFATFQWNDPTPSLVSIGEDIGRFFRLGKRLFRKVLKR